MERKLTDKQRQDLILRHRQERDKRIGDRIKAVLAFDDGYNDSEVVRLLLLDDATIRRHMNDYQLLERKFKTLPEHYKQKIEVASCDDLLEWNDKVLGSQALEEIFET